MAEVMEDVEFDNDDFGHQGCYVFRPSTTDNDIDDRPKKKRKTAKEAKTSQESWPRLLLGTESSALAGLREQTFRSLWSRLEDKAQTILYQVDDTILNDLRHFINGNHSSNSRLKTGLIVSTSQGASQNHWLEQLKEKSGRTKEIIVQLQASQAPNLQVALKNIIRNAIETYSGLEECSSFLASKKRLIPMAFDLELLQKYVEQRHLSKIVVSFQDVETFDTGVLSDIISTLTSWTDRISFIVLLGIATTIDLFESRLSRSVIRLLDTTTFNLISSKDQKYEVFCSIQCDPKTSLYLGPSTINTLYELTQDQSATTSSFIQSLKYTYMTHFFANPLSTMLEAVLLVNEDFTHVCEAIRHTPSFRAHCEILSSQGASRTETVRQLLDNDSFLLARAQAWISSGINSLRVTNERIRHLVALYQQIRPSQESALQLYAQFLQSIPNVGESPAYESLSESLSLITSDALITLIFTHPDIFPKITGQTLSQLTTSISKLHTKHSTSSIRPTSSPSNSLFSPTKPVPSSAAQKNTRGSSPTSSPHSQPISQQLPSPPPPTTLPLNESFLINTRSPLHSTFTPRPRFAIERALASPADYLGCECCCSPNSRLVERSARDTTSVLYGLVSEAGREINVRDLWDTFSSIIARGSEEEEEPSKSRSMGTDADTSLATANAKAKSILKSPATAKGKSKPNGTNGVGADQEASTLENDGTPVPALDEERQNEESETHNLSLFYAGLANLKMLGLLKSSTAAGAANAGAGGTGGGAGEGSKRRERGVDVISRTGWKGL